MIALGFFDGVHIGHAALMRRTSELAESAGAVSMALTFDRHPDELTRGEPVLLLDTKEERSEIIKKKFGIDEVEFLKFDAELMRMPWDRFLEDILIGQMEAVHLVVGHDFCFGYKGLGTAPLLKERCGQLGIGCDIIPEVEMDGITVSSTHIRSLVAQGNVERAAQFLGYRYFISGYTRRGRGIGHRELFATANIPLPDGLLSPARGVYATRVMVDGRLYDAVTNVGINPTVGETSEVVIESHIFDFDSELSGTYLRVFFYRFLRSERKFADVTALREQISRDIAASRECLVAFPAETDLF